MPEIHGATERHVEEVLPQAGPDWESVYGKSVSGLKVLGARHLILQVVGFAAGVLLARLLTPEAFGQFALANFIVCLGAVFTDLGLGAALVQKRDEPAKADVQTVFTSIMTLTSIVVALLFWGAPVVMRLYRDLPDWSPWLVRVMALSLLVTPMRTIPLLLLERKLKYRQIALLETGEGLAYHITAITCALAGLGVWSFVLGIVSRNVVGVVLAFVLIGKFPRFGFDKDSAVPLLRFGIPMQLQSFSSVLNGAVAPVLIGGLVGPAALGYISWSGNLGTKPLQLAEILGRITFAGYSRLQADLTQLRKGMETTLEVTARFIFPLSLIGIALAPSITRFVYSDTWLPAVFALQVYLVSIIPSFIGVVPARGLIALGESRTVLYLNLLSTGALWAGTTLLLPFSGFTSVPIAITLATSIEMLLRIRAIKRVMRINVLKYIATPCVAGTVAGVVAASVQAYVSSIAELVGVIFLSSGVYALVLKFVERRQQRFQPSGSR
jgi:teichuronic acid exporter